MRRWISVILLAAVLIIGCPGARATAAVTEEKISVDAKSAVLMEATTGTVLFSQNSAEALPPASVTKIMTLLLVMEAIDCGKISLDDTVSISKNAAGMGGSQVYLKEGEDFSVDELLKCCVIASANDAAVALAEHTYGSESIFVQMMNVRAGELGLRSTKFENVTGLDDTTVAHLTSAQDIAIMSKELIRHEKILEYSRLWQDSIRDGEFILTNTNRLVRYYKGCTGLKTGSTDKAGYCVSVTAERDGMSLICVVMGAETRDKRNEIATGLLDYGFSQYGIFSSPARRLEAVPVLRGVCSDVFVESTPFSCVMKKTGSEVECKYEIPENLSAPIEKGQKIGKIYYELDGEKIGESDIIACASVAEISFWEIFWRITMNFIMGARNG